MTLSKKVHLSKPFKIIVNGISSPELLLWKPIIDDFISKNRDSIYKIGKNLAIEDENYLKSKLRIYKISEINHDSGEEILFFLCLPNQIPKEFKNLKNQKIGCFFGGLNSLSLLEQVKSAHSRKINFLFSDLLPSEMKNLIPNNHYKYFYNSQIFLPHCYNENTITFNQNLDHDFLLLTNQNFNYKNGSHSIVLNSIIKTFSKDKRIKHIDIKNIDYNFIDFLLENIQCKKVITINISISLLQFITDICKLKSIELSNLYNIHPPSKERVYLNYNEKFYDLSTDFTKLNEIRNIITKLISSTKNKYLLYDNKFFKLLEFKSVKLNCLNSDKNNEDIFIENSGKLKLFKNINYKRNIIYNKDDLFFNLKHPESDIIKSYSDKSRLEFYFTLIENNELKVLNENDKFHLNEFCLIFEQLSNTQTNSIILNTLLKYVPRFPNLSLHALKYLFENRKTNKDFERVSLYVVISLSQSNIDSITLNNYVDFFYNIKSDKSLIIILLLHFKNNTDFNLPDTDPITINKVITLISSYNLILNPNQKIFLKNNSLDTLNYSTISTNDLYSYFLFHIYNNIDLDINDIKKEIPSRFSAFTHHPMHLVRLSRNSWIHGNINNFHSIFNQINPQFLKRDPNALVSYNSLKLLSDSSYAEINFDVVKFLSLKNFNIYKIFDLHIHCLYLNLELNYLPLYKIYNYKFYEKINQIITDSYNP